MVSDPGVVLGLLRNPSSIELVQAQVGEGFLFALHRLSTLLT